MPVWLANESGVIVTGTARPDAQEYLRSLGAAHTVNPTSEELESMIERAAKQGFDAALIAANGDTLPAFLDHLKAKAPFAYPNGVEPKPSRPGHRVLAFDGGMSREAFERLNTAIGPRTIPLRVHTFPFTEVVEAHRRIEQGHVIGKIVLHFEA